MKKRHHACNFEVFEQTTQSFPRELYGPGSEELDYGMGEVSYEKLKEVMRTSRVYFYTGTHPASYTLNFMEAWMTGIPIVAIGPQYGNASYFPGHNLYEVPYLIRNGIDGFISDNPATLQGYVRDLLEDEKLAQQISVAGRASAMQTFGKDVIKQQWRNYLGD